jgi:hypothetical protein
MSDKYLNNSLEIYEIGISGAIPERRDWSEPAMDRGILEFVSLFSGIVFKYGGRIVHGSHPAFTPIILRQARLHAGSRRRRPVTLVRSDLWASDLTDDKRQSMTDIAELIITRRIGEKGPDDPTTRNASLTAMRRVLVDSQNVMVAVGGKMHAADGIRPGVGEEMQIAIKKKVPCFLVGGLGGFSRKLAMELTPEDLGNHLSRDANVTLFGTTDVGACVGVLFGHLISSKRLARASRQPIKWNPGLKKVVDHRNGAVNVASSSVILDACST